MEPALLRQVEAQEAEAEEVPAVADVDGLSAAEVQQGWEWEHVKYTKNYQNAVQIH